MLGFRACKRFGKRGANLTKQLNLILGYMINYMKPNGLAMLSDFVFHKICNIGSVIPCFFEHLENNLQKSVFLFCFTICLIALKTVYLLYYNTKNIQYDILYRE